MLEQLCPADTHPIWLAHLLDEDYAPATAKRYGGAVSGFLGWGEEQERRPLQFPDLTPILLTTYRRSLQQRRSTSTTNLHVSALRMWCQWLAENAYLETNPAERLKTIGRATPDAPVALSNSAVNALLRTAQRSRYAQRNYAICQLLLQTGMRLGECQALRWQDLTYKERKGSVLIRAGKGNKARTVPLNSSARTALAEYVAPQLRCEPTPKAIASAWEQLPQEAPMWMSQKGKVLTSSAIWRMFVALVADCAARGLVSSSAKPHDLRHTFAHRYLEQHPGDLVGLARILGHESLETTKVYLRLSEADLAERIEVIGLNAYE